MKYLKHELYLSLPLFVRIDWKDIIVLAKVDSWFGGFEDLFELGWYDFLSYCLALYLPQKVSLLTVASVHLQV